MNYGECSNMKTHLHGFNKANTEHQAIYNILRNLDSLSSEDRAYELDLFSPSNFNAVKNSSDMNLIPFVSTKKDPVKGFILETFGQEIYSNLDYSEFMSFANMHRRTALALMLNTYIHKRFIGKITPSFRILEKHQDMSYTIELKLFEEVGDEFKTTIEKTCQLHIDGIRILSMIESTAAA